MANVLDTNGLTLNTQAELIAYFTGAYKSIYGNDINLDSDTPDGQMMMVFIQAILDVQDLLMQVYNSFDPDNAIGNVLDQRVAINGIQRQAGTHTVTNVTVTTTQALTLYGIDQVDQDPFTVSDNQGNRWNLLESVNLPSPGDQVLAFQAETPGAVLSVPNTITVPVTVVLGVSAVNNPTTYTTLGIDEETDAELKIRRQKSVSLSSQGYMQGLLAALENITGVTDAFVYENDTGSPDGDGIPGHSIWVIVNQGVSASAIANAIYLKRNAGCGMKGDETFSVQQADGSLFTIRWDWILDEDLYIEFTATPLDGETPVQYEAIKNGLVTALAPGPYEEVNINELATLVQQIDPNCLVTNAGFDTTSGGSFTNPTLTPIGKNYKFFVEADRVIILPILVTPDDPSVAGGETQQFEAVGGYGDYTWTVEVDSSGGASINSSTGLYTAGSFSGTDTIRATDENGNYTDVNVNVT